VVVKVRWRGLASEELGQHEPDHRESAASPVATTRGSVPGYIHLAEEHPPVACIQLCVALGKVDAEQEGEQHLSARDPTYKADVPIRQER
jgi:hypothetical protein